MSEVNASVMAAIITSLAALGVAIGNAIATRRMNAAQAAKANAETEKIKAEAAAMANAEWRNLYEKMQQRCDDYERRMINMETAIKIRNKVIDDMFDWLVENEKAMIEAGIKVPDVSDIRFRGSDKDESSGG